MKISIERLGLKDIELLLELRMEVLSHVFAKEREKMKETEWESLRQENRRYYLSELEKEGHLACLARVGGQVAGCGGICLYREMPSPDNHSGLCGYLMNIYTRRDYRRQGVAGAICRWLIGEGKARGAEKIYLETSDCGRKLYQSLGFEDMHDYLKLTDC